MKTLDELGAAVSERRRSLGLQQGAVATRAGVRQEWLSRLERGRLADLGTRKLLAVLAVLGLELELRGVGYSGTLDELRKERRGS